jgi:hypothetical protein
MDRRVGASVCGIEMDLLRGLGHASARPLASISRFGTHSNGLSDRRFISDLISRMILFP